MRGALPCCSTPLLAPSLGGQGGQWGKTPLHSLGKHGESFLATPIPYQECEAATAPHAFSRPGSPWPEESVGSKAGQLQAKCYYCSFSWKEFSWKFTPGMNTCSYPLILFIRPGIKHFLLSKPLARPWVEGRFAWFQHKT